MKFESFFRSAYGQGAHGPLTPFDYQRRLAEECMWPAVVNVPTGLGKTAAVTLAWLYKRGWRSGGRVASADSRTPRRLLCGLPVGVFVAEDSEGRCVGDSGCSKWETGSKELQE